MTPQFGTGVVFYRLLLSYKNIPRASAVRSTNLGSILIFASCVVGTCSVLPGMWVCFFLMGGVLLFYSYCTPLVEGISSRKYW